MHISNIISSVWKKSAFFCTIGISIDNTIKHQVWRAKAPAKKLAAQVLFDGGQQLVRGGRWLFARHQQIGLHILCALAFRCFQLGHPGNPCQSCPKMAESWRNCENFFLSLSGDGQLLDFFLHLDSFSLIHSIGTVKWGPFPSLS